ncbi:MAG: class I SAM-dependent methyltransferase [Rhodocyclaceae bacterium]
MSLTIELALSWASAHARHCDRHWFGCVDPFETDLPQDFAAQLAKLGAGETARCAITTPTGTLEARILERNDAPADGWLALLSALKHGILQQAELTALEGLAEPYDRPHTDDAAFYAQPRLVDHLDRTALAVWETFTARFVTPELAVLDLMASHDSHLPANLTPARLVGLGMNAVELEHNPKLDERLVHDLNVDTALPFTSGEFDLVLCALSIEYLIRPEAVLREVRRVLKPGGRCVVSFSGRWFPPKVVAPWPRLNPFLRVAWVLRHFLRTGFGDLHTESLRGLPRPADDKYIAQTKFADPLHAVWGTA